MEQTSWKIMKELRIISMESVEEVSFTVKRWQLEKYDTFQLITIFLLGQKLLAFQRESIA